MATIDRSTIEELMQRGESLDLGPTRVAVFEEAVRLADMLADVPLGYQARTRLIDAAQFSGAGEVDGGVLVVPGPVRPRSHRVR